MSEFIFVGDLCNPDPLLEAGGVESRYLGAVDDDGNLTISDERNPGGAWITSSTFLSPSQYRSIGGDA